MHVAKGAKGMNLKSECKIYKGDGSIKKLLGTRFPKHIVETKKNILGRFSNVAFNGVDWKRVSDDIGRLLIWTGPTPRLRSEAGKKKRIRAYTRGAKVPKSVSPCSKLIDELISQPFVPRPPFQIYPGDRPASVIERFPTKVELSRRYYSKSSFMSVRPLVFNMIRDSQIFSIIRL